jgi:hypothetical protein
VKTCSHVEEAGHQVHHKQRNKILFINPYLRRTHSNSEQLLFHLHHLRYLKQSYHFGQLINSRQSRQPNQFQMTCVVDDDVFNEIKWNDAHKV